MRALVVMHNIPIADSKGALFDVGTVALSFKAAKAVHAHGARHFRQGIAQHRRGECMCGDPQHFQRSMFEIRNGLPVLTTYDAGSEVLVFLTNSSRDKTICCTADESPSELLSMYEEESQGPQVDA